MRDRRVLIDRKFLWAAGYAFFGAALAAIGLIHGEKVEFFADVEISLGYAFLGLVCLGFAALKVPEREIDPEDPVDAEDAAARAAARAGRRRRRSASASRCRRRERRQ